MIRRVRLTLFHPREAPASRAAPFLPRKAPAFRAALFLPAGGTASAHDVSALSALREQLTLAAADTYVRPDFSWYTEPAKIPGAPRTQAPRGPEN
ncbi:hypothetical protein GCM10018785_05270 [Streptomyces longispororuber]|uniref:Uncharacterized protein n=1 Tax=Streptomyces longispororuber TaxID=68230 RepID=A0A919DEN9_9ACTN|nr:hypothetical protein GCM10018785_05270 [Streptomyces longispororuber]